MLTLGHNQGDDDLLSKMFGFYFLKYLSHVNSSKSLDVFIFFPVITLKRSYSLSEIFVLTFI